MSPMMFRPSFRAKYIRSISSRRIAWSRTKSKTTSLCCPSRLSVCPVSLCPSRLCVRSFSLCPSRVSLCSSYLFLGLLHQGVLVSTGVELGQQV